MKQSKQSLGLLLFAVLSVSVLAVAPVSARHASAESEVETTSSTQSSNDSTDTKTETEVADNTSTTKVDESSSSDSQEQEHGISAARLAALKSKAQAELAGRREGKQQTSVARRQKLCQNRQKAVDNKIHAFGNAADKHLTKLNDVFTKLQAYQKDKQLNVTNYQALVDAATAKQQAATTAVSSLKAVAVNIDCTSTDPASSLTVVKDAAHQARQALQDYRMSLKAIVVAMAQARGTTTSSTTTTDTATGSTN